MVASKLPAQPLPTPSGDENQLVSAHEPATCMTGVHSASPFQLSQVASAATTFGAEAGQVTDEVSQEP